MGGRSNPWALVGALVGALCLLGCAPGGESDGLDFPGGEGGKTDSLGRGLAGVASDYEPTSLDFDALRTNMRKRREAAWHTVFKVLEPAPLLGLADGSDAKDDIELSEGEMPTVARWQTWYGVDDLKRMFQFLYTGLTPAQRAVRVDFSDDALSEAIVFNANVIERSTQWPLERYLKFVRSLGECPDSISDEECARLVRERFGGAVSGTARILYSPAMADHILRNYRRTLGCLDELDALPMNATPTSNDNFTQCFDTEAPAGSVLIKAQWARADFGRDVPVYDTHADALASLFAGTAHWGEAGDRRRTPGSSSIVTIRLRGGNTYRLVGLHIMTKELRHWQWITLWWSDEPTTDFGQDRPSAIREALPPVWSHYKMCVVDDYLEGDPGSAARYSKARSLADALSEIERAGAGATWCSNPYLEHGRNNARTNCIGCHQHGGSTKTFDLDGDGTLDPLTVESLLEEESHFPNASRTQIRDVFPADYLFSINRVDDFAHMIANEVGFHDASDATSVSSRIAAILARTGDAARGSTMFGAHCAPCHGANGEGGPSAPSLAAQLPNRDDPFVLQTLIQGRGQMPTWGESFNNESFADLLAHLRDRFGP